VDWLWGVSESPAPVTALTTEPPTKPSRSLTTATLEQPPTKPSRSLTTAATTEPPTKPSRSRVEGLAALLGVRACGAHGFAVRSGELRSPAARVARAVPGMPCGACSGRRSCSAFGLRGLRLPSFASLRSAHRRPSSPRALALRFRQEIVCGGARRPCPSPSRAGSQASCSPRAPGRRAVLRPVDPRSAGVCSLVSPPGARWRSAAATASSGGLRPPSERRGAP
jgi:hypothetical protein